MRLLNRLLSTFILIIMGVLISPFIHTIALANMQLDAIKLSIFFSVLILIIIPLSYFFSKGNALINIVYFVVGTVFFGLFFSGTVNLIHAIIFAQHYPVQGQINMAHLKTDGSCELPALGENVPYSRINDTMIVMLCPYVNKLSSIKYQVMQTTWSMPKNSGGSSK